MDSLTLSYALADQSFLRTKSLGILNFSVDLASRLSVALTAPEHLTVFSNSTLQKRLHLAPENDVQDFTYAAQSRAGRFLWDQWNIVSAANRTGNNWLMLPKGFASFVRRPRAQVAAYVHDVMHDVYRRNYPSAFPWYERLYFRQALVATLRQAKVIFTSTDFARSEVLRVAAELGRRPYVVTAGIGFTRNPKQAAPRPREGVVLLVSRWPHKRTDLALAHLQAWQQRTGYAEKIHLVGGLPKGLAVPEGAQWVHHPRPDDAAFAELFATMRALIYFSSYEGFGMPPVEAILTGAVAVCSDIAATREVMGPCGLFFQNESIDSFTGAMNAALLTPPETVEAWANELLARHSWDGVVGRVLRELRG